MRLCLVVAALLASAHGWLKVLLCHRFDGLGLPVLLSIGLATVGLSCRVCGVPLLFGFRFCMCVRGVASRWTTVRGLNFFWLKGLALSLCCFSFRVCDTNSVYTWVSMASGFLRF